MPDDPLTQAAPASVPPHAGQRSTRDAGTLTSMRGFDSSAVSLAFPLGGIGTGNVSLGARGELRDWEIFNHASKGTRLPNTFFALWARAQGQAAVARVLEGPLQPPHNLSHGYHPNTAAGLPHCAGTRFRGEYPLALVEWLEPALPVTVALEAYTPLIPLNPQDSGLPCAVLSFSLTNHSDLPVEVTLVGSLCNPIGGVAFDDFGNIAKTGVGQNVNSFRTETNLQGVYLASEQFAAGDLRAGSLALVTTHPRVTVKPQWLRGQWYDDLQEFWDDLSADGRLEPLGYATPSAPGRTDTASLGALDTLAPGESRTITFWLAWHFPNRTNSWDNRPSAASIRNRYAVRFADAWAVAGYAVGEATRLERETRAFHEALFSSSLPPEVLDALSANIVPLRSPTCFWLEDGRFFGFEGCFDDHGCCEGTCTHVWSYAQTVAYLFPSLEREMRRIEFVYETNDAGWMAFRNHQTFDEVFIWPEGGQPEAAVDGQLGSILRVYREWLLSGDRVWLETVWPGVKRALGYASAKWDPDGDGVLEGRQHTTYDIEFDGPNPLGTLYYLAALRAARALAAVLGETGLAERLGRAAEQGSARADEALWNGEYYQQVAALDAQKYQHGSGCLSDQLMGQWHAHLLGLGELLPAEHVRGAIQAVYRHNFKPSLSGHVNFQRTYALPDEAGLVLCTWPRGGRPRFPFVYSDEVWTGIEYEVAAELIYDGWLAEGLKVVATARQRHDGQRRNPWDEVECGHHYARSMASWSVLLALSGFQCDVARGLIQFDPVVAASPEPGLFRTFWSCGRGWGVYTQRQAADGAWAPSLTVLGGDLSGMELQACGRRWRITPAGLEANPA